MWSTPVNGIAESWGRCIFNLTETNKQFFLVGVAIYTYSFGGEIWMGPILVTLWEVGFPGGSDSKESACNMGDLGLIPGLGRSPGEGHGNPLQYSCLENPHGQRSLVGHSPWGPKELDTAERQSTAAHRSVVTILMLRARKLRLNPYP